jgi:predicted ATPase
MLEKLEFVEDWRCFKTGDAIDFRPGVNLLVGDQGSGKSSLLQAIAAVSKAKNYKFEHSLAKKVKVTSKAIKCGGFDFEKDNHRTQGYFDENIQAHMALMFSSHGQGNLAILQTMTNFSDTLLFLDEPDMALSIRSVSKLSKLFQEAATRGCQIVAAVHNPILIQAFTEVYSLERRAWVWSKEFVNSQLDILMA